MLSLVLNMPSTGLQDFRSGRGSFTSSYLSFPLGAPVLPLAHPAPPAPSQLVTWIYVPGSPLCSLERLLSPLWASLIQLWDG